MIENPRGEQKILKNKDVTNRKKGAEDLKPEDITQIQPQKLTLTLRSGEMNFINNQGLFNAVLNLVRISLDT